MNDGGYVSKHIVANFLSLASGAIIRIKTSINSLCRSILIVLLMTSHCLWLCNVSSLIVIINGFRWLHFEIPFLFLVRVIDCICQIVADS